MQEMVKVEGLSKSYHGRPVITDLNLSVAEGTVFGLLGANGAGKSTTIECILGTRKADKGQISILGQSPQTNRKKLFEQVSVQFQETNYQEQITVAELCETTASLYHNAENPLELLRQFGIEDKQKCLVKELSGGQKQRLFIVLALIPKPKLVFLDELTTGLDPKARRTVWQTLSKLKEKGLTIFLVSHFMDEIEALCDSICILRQGKIVFYGSVAEAVAQSPYENFEDAYLWYTGEEETDYESI